MAIKINKEKCIGCGACNSTCPEVFDMGSDGKAKVKAQKKLPCVKKAIDECPVNAIKQ
jgi:ferredoxin